MHAAEEEDALVAHVVAGEVHEAQGVDVAVDRGRVGRGGGGFGETGITIMAAAPSSSSQVRSQELKERADSKRSAGAELGEYFK